MRLLSLTAAAILAATTAHAQLPQMPQVLDLPPKPWPQVMVLGTVHFANPGADAVKTKLDDVLAPERQKQIDDVVESLARYKPTKIAVEVPPSQEAKVNADYQAYLAGNFTLTRNEMHQIAFRLAKRLGHTRLYAVDNRIDLDFDTALKYAATHGQQDQIAWFTSVTQKLDRYFGDVYAHGTIAQILAVQNDDDHASEGIGMYQLLARMGGDTVYAGADLASDWYKRNMRIYANVLRVTTPSDRVLLVIGGGHRPLLRQMFQQTPGLEFVPTLPYLQH